MSEESKTKLVELRLRYTFMVVGVQQQQSSFDKGVSSKKSVGWICAYCDIVVFIHTMHKRSTYQLDT